MARRSRCSPEVKERAVRMVLDQQHQHESQWAAIVSVASKIGCTSETLRKWVRQAERDTGKRVGLTTDERTRLKALEREVRELKRANDTFPSFNWPFRISPPLYFTVCRIILLSPRALRSMLSR